MGVGKISKDQIGDGFCALMIGDGEHWRNWSWHTLFPANPPTLSTSKRPDTFSLMMQCLAAGIYMRTEKPVKKLSSPFHNAHGRGKTCVASRVLLLALQSFKIHLQATLDISLGRIEIKEAKCFEHIICLASRSQHQSSKLGEYLNKSKPKIFIINWPN